MTTKKVVADDTLGEVAKKQWELFRRVKEGSLDPTTVINAIQSIIENQVEQLDIEKVNLIVSSRVYEVSVEEDVNFVDLVKAYGYMWEWNNHRHGDQFILAGVPSRRKRKSCLRLAEIPYSRGNEKYPMVVKTYANLAGFDLATSWELLAFVRQSPAMQIVKEGSRVTAFGDCGYTRYGDDRSIGDYSYVEVDPFLKHNTWSFSTSGLGKSPDELSRRENSYSYILLRERK